MLEKVDKILFVNLLCYEYTAKAGSFVLSQECETFNFVDREITRARDRFGGCDWLSRFSSLTHFTAF